MHPDTNRHLRALFDAHDQAFRALRTANQATGAAVQAHDEAIRAALAANRAAIDLLEHLTGNGQR